MLTQLYGEIMKQTVKKQTMKQETKQIVTQDFFDEKTSDNQEKEEFTFDEVRGSFGKKPKMAILNKTKLSKYELDDLFTSEETQEPVDEEA